MLVKGATSVLIERDLEVIRSGHFPACNPLCIQLEWRQLFELSWFYLNCNPKYRKKTTMVLISKACTEWWSTHTFEEQNEYPLLLGFSASCHFKLAWLLLCLTLCTWMCISCYSPPSGVPLQAAVVRVSPVSFQCLVISNKFFQWCSRVSCKYSLGLAGSPSGILLYIGSTNGIPAYTRSASVHWLRVSDVCCC